MRKFWQENLTDLSTSPVRCSHFTLGNPKKSFLTVLFIYTSDYLRNLRRKKTLIYLSIPPENVTILTYELFVAFFQTLEARKRASCGLSSVAPKKTGCDVWQLECQASNVTASVQSNHLLHWYMLPVFFDTDQSHSTPRYAEIQPMSQQAAAASLNTSISIHALLL